MNRPDLQPLQTFEIQICPICDVPAESEQGTELIQHFTLENFRNVVNAWETSGKPEIRVDKDHNSERTDNTEASGWITRIWVEDDKGLMGELKVTDVGAEALNGQSYRYGSPCFVCDEEGNPIELVSFALTNRPRIKGLQKIYNSEPISSDEVNIVKEQNMDLNTLKEILGLPEEATEENVIEAINAMKAKIVEIEDKAITAEAEQVANECGVDDEKKEVIVNSYKTDKNLTLNIIEALKKESAPLVVNSADAVKPELDENAKLVREYKALKGSQARVDFLMAHKGLKM